MLPHNDDLLSVGTLPTSAGLDSRTITVTQLRIDDGRRRLVTCAQLILRTGTALVVVGEPGPAHSAFALALSGRLAPTSGFVLLDGHPDVKGLQTCVALVDVAGVSEPDPHLRLHFVVAEQLALARKPSGRRMVRDWLERRGATDLFETPIEDVPAETRVCLLCELASERPGLDFMVVSAPDRHGTATDHWWAQCDQLARRGFGVLATCSPATAMSLPAKATVAVAGLEGSLA